MRYDQGYYLRMFRAKYDLTQAAAGAFFKMSPSHWSLLEDGKRCAAPELAEKLAEATNADMRLFLGLVSLWRPAKEPPIP